MTAIKYHELDIQQRGQIWKQFLEFVLEQKVEGKGTEIDPELLKDECLKELAMKPFNGTLHLRKLGLAIEWRCVVQVA